MKLQPCIDELVKRGLHDWIQAAELAWVAKSTGGAVTQEEIRRLSLELIREVVQRGLMKVGDLKKDGFHEWHVPPEEAIERVKREWIILKGGPNLGQVCWLANTEQGDQEAKRLLNLIIGSEECQGSSDTP